MFKIRSSKHAFLLNTPASTRIVRKHACLRSIHAHAVYTTTHHTYTCVLCSKMWLRVYAHHAFRIMHTQTFKIEFLFFFIYIYFSFY